MLPMNDKMKVLNQNWRHRTQSPVYIVSGLPRSGTTMMMQMLEAGGMDILTDTYRKPDKDNPNGYYEYEKVKRLGKDISWLKEAKGKAIKIVSPLLFHLPSIFKYKILFMRRNMMEILASQGKMLERRGIASGNKFDEILTVKFERHLKKANSWLESKDNIKVHYVNYKTMIVNPMEQATLVNEFLGNILNIENMMSVVDRSLYRQRK